LSQLEEAIAIALQAHKGAFDKSGQPYILHPLHIMMQMETEEARITAMLHDVIEDSNITMADLASSGFSTSVLEALELLTHNKESVAYSDYIFNIKENALARNIKLADLKHNMDIQRLQTPLTEEDLERLNKYRQAWDILSTS
jgi:(p)ppGpp synthase/HD superfamily hydrolase